MTQHLDAPKIVVRPDADHAIADFISATPVLDPNARHQDSYADAHADGDGPGHTDVHSDVHKDHQDHGVTTHTDSYADAHADGSNPHSDVHADNHGDENLIARRDELLEYLDEIIQRRFERMEKNIMDVVVARIDKALKDR